MKITGTKIFAYGEEIEMKETQYRNKRAAIQLVSAETGEPYGMLTVNIPEFPLDEEEILVKAWSENEPYRAPALATGLFQDTGKRAPAGFTEAEVWLIVM